MKLYSAVAVAAAVFIAGAPALASATAFSIDFETDWNSNPQVFAPDINDYYNGGTASNGASGPNRGVSFVNVSGLSNQSPDFTYYANAPSPLGIAFVHDTAYLNVASGVSNALSFFYSSPTNVIGAVRAFSGLNGTGTLLGTVDLVANFINGPYDNWSLATLRFGGVAQSFDFTRSADTAAFDNLATVPEPGMGLMLGLGGAAALVARRRRRA